MPPPNNNPRASLVIVTPQPIPVIGGRPETGWQPIATAPKTGRALFYLEWADDVRPLNEPLPVDVERVELTTFGGWSSVFKATHWQPLPSPPRQEQP
jgi:hypothetical protein